MLRYSDSFYSAKTMFVGIFSNSDYRDDAYRDSAMRKTRPTRTVARHCAAERPPCFLGAMVFLASTTFHPTEAVLLLSLTGDCRAGSNARPLFCGCALRTDLLDVAQMIGERRPNYQVLRPAYG